MSPLSEVQLHQIRDERKEQILGAAAVVFARRGITGTKMSMIAVEAGISHGLLYHYFSSKDQLFSAIVRLAMEESFETIANVYEIPGSPLEKLTELTRFILDKGNSAFFALIYEAQTSENVPEEARKLLEEYPLQRYIDLLLPLFIEGQQRGEFITNNAEELITWYFSIISGLMVVNNHEASEYSIPDAERLLRIFAVP